MCLSGGGRFLVTGSVLLMVGRVQAVRCRSRQASRAPGTPHDVTVAVATGSSSEGGDMDKGVGGTGHAISMSLVRGWSSPVRLLSQQVDRRSFSFFGGRVWGGGCVREQSQRH